MDIIRKHRELLCIQVFGNHEQNESIEADVKISTRYPRNRVPKLSDYDFFKDLVEHSDFGDFLTPYFVLPSASVQLRFIPGGEEAFEKYREEFDGRLEGFLPEFRELEKKHGIRLESEQDSVEKWKEDPSQFCEEITVIQHGVMFLNFTNIGEDSTFRDLMEILLS